VDIFNRVHDRGAAVNRDHPEDPRGLLRYHARAARGLWDQVPDDRVAPAGSAQRANLEVLASRQKGSRHFD